MQMNAMAMQMASISIHLPLHQSRVNLKMGFMFFRQKQKQHLPKMIFGPKPKQKLSSILSRK